MGVGNRSTAPRWPGIELPSFRETRSVVEKISYCLANKERCLDFARHGRKPKAASLNRLLLSKASLQTTRTLRSRGCPPKHHSLNRSRSIQIRDDPQSLQSESRTNRPDFRQPPCD